MSAGVHYFILFIIPGESRMSDELIEQIHRAFATSVYPGDENLVANPDDEEPQFVAGHFKGKTDWRTLDAEFLNAAPDALALLADDAFRFYLPAFLIADIRGELEYVDPTVRLCWSHTSQGGDQKVAKVWGGGTMREHAEACHNQFSAAQSAAMVRWAAFRESPTKYAGAINSTTSTRPRAINCC